ncbi:MAG: hypothetical protein ACFFDX_13670 [Candidatus Odinarchaeota archaeon]
MIRLVLLFSLISMSGFILIGFNLVSLRTREKYYDKNFSVKSNDDEVSIITPENVTYTEPMSGYYPATYGFENDKLNTLAQGWTKIIAAGTDAYVIQSFNNHNSVFQLYDNTASSDSSVKSIFAEQDFGTIEFWCAVTDVSQNGAFAFNLRDSFNIHGPEFWIRNGNFVYNDGTLHDITSASNNQWYRIRVDFRCTGASVYEGLSENAYFLYINGIRYGEYPFMNNLNSVASIAMGVGTASINSAYIDAVGYSWDSNYNIGDNLNKGLLLSFENSTTLDWMGYSLDGLANKTIMGNTTLPLPANGAHNIQVFGNNSFGTMYASNLRYFTINITHYIEIHTPENMTYIEPMSGYYPATYGFENDEIGSVPQGWTDGSLGSGVVEVIEEEDQHKNVLHIQSGSTINNQGVALLELEDLTSGTVEYWIKFDNANPPPYYIYAFDLREDLNIKVSVRIVANEWKYYDGSVYQSICPAEANKWYHLRVTWDMVSDTSDIYVYHANNKLAGSVIGATNYATGTTVNELFIAMHNEVINTNIWVDAVGVSWDPNYNFGDNMQEGLLLSFDSSFTPEWIGYSLDGLANKTIFGNATLPLPANGAHNIQVFGNDSLGALYASNLRHFTLDVPIINIITPENKTYTEPMSGYYPATHGFENDKYYTFPQGWTEPGYYSPETYVIPSLNGHHNVFQIYDDTSSHDTSVTSNFTAEQQFGTIELWCAVSDVFQATPIAINLRDEFNTQGPSIGIRSGYFAYNDGVWRNIIPVFSNQWYHIRMVFRCNSAPAYEGLSENCYYLYINQIKYGEFSFHNTVNNAVRIAIGVGYIAINSAYIDAIGYSWDPYYNVGDNFNEGLLLTFTNRTKLDWRGYSLDDLANKTILGDTTLPLPPNGVHNIQVFGNDSLGIMYESEIRYFSINIPPPSISIITPSIDEFYSNNAPPFSISITSFYQTTTWYTLDGGGTNITFTGSSGIINQTEWDKQGEVSITIRFYVNDSLGRLNYADITINKDITDPVITINSPLFGDLFTTMPPSFNISVDELNIDVMWYSIDGGLTTYNISQYSGYINSAAWNAAPNGAITILFYVVDKAGNEDYENVIVQKDAPPYIPPDNSLIIILSVAIGVFIAATAILLVVFLIRKRRARPPKPPKPPKPVIRPRPDLKIPPKQVKKIVPPSHVIVQREVIVIEKKPSEKERLDRETEKRFRLEEEKKKKQVRCLYCGTLIDYDARFCHECGSEQ